MKTKILFISWDGPQTSYMEGLFLPIFNQISKNDTYEFHVLQFTWGPAKSSTAIFAKQAGISFSTISIIRKPSILIGSFLSLFTGSRKIEKYMHKHQIDIVMPRSTFPAFMVNQIKPGNFKIIFDADGLPIEERVDFSGLLRSSRMYKWLKKQETKMLRAADSVITRSKQSIAIHLKAIGDDHAAKFSVVYNGRDELLFKPETTVRNSLRKQLGFLEDETVFIYSGSLGPQYGWEEMLEIFEEYEQLFPSKWLIMTGNIEYAQARIPSKLTDRIIVKNVNFQEVSQYLNVADIAFAIRKPTFSMKGIAPIKLGEYLLMDIPTIASAGIGDTELIIKRMKKCFLYHHKSPGETANVLDWIKNLKNFSDQSNRTEAVDIFSLQAAADTYTKVLENLR